MARIQKNYWFRPGRNVPGGRRNPGILSVDSKYEFTSHECSKDGQSWSYSCKYRQTQKIRCPAKASVVKVEDKWILAFADDEHNCETNRPRVVAEHLRHKMKELVRKDPCCKNYQGEGS